VSFFKGRLFTGDKSLNVWDLPGAFVAESTVDRDGALATGGQYEVRFNEAMAIASVQASISVTNLDTGEPVEVDVTALDAQGQGAERFALEMELEPGTRYEVRIDGAQSLRSTGMWLPFVSTFRTADEGAE
jgi:hypothetical protein